MKNLQRIEGPIEGRFDLPISKSMVGRALLLAALFPEVTLSNMSTSEDSVFLSEVLKGYLPQDGFVGAGGTTLRFATAYWATRAGSVQQLRGTNTLNKRPIAPLVDALNALGGDVRYVDKAGEAPLRIHGRELVGGEYSFGHLNSSQFITALMLVSPTMKNGLQLHWDSVPSQSYLVMTAALLREAGFRVVLTSHSFQIEGGQKPEKVTLFMERDWSAVAFWCEAVALSSEAEITLEGFEKSSLQGDSRVLDYFEPLGVGASFKDGNLVLKKRAVLPLGKYTANLISEPDLAQALVTTLVHLKIPFEIFGLQTLINKETNRIAALQEMAERFGVALKATKESLSCEEYPDELILSHPTFKSYEDHRVAMSLAPLSLRYPIAIDDPEVVGKSYPSFWEHWAQL